MRAAPADERGAPVKLQAVDDAGADKRPRLGRRSHHVLPSIRNHEQLIHLARRWGFEEEVLGQLPLGQSMVAFKSGGDRQPPIVITAGSHADEVAGVFAALRLLIGPGTDHAVHVVLCRDPVGFNGWNWTLSEVTGQEINVSNNEEAVAALERHTEVLYREEERGIMLGLAGDFGFATMPHRKYISADLARFLLADVVANDSELNERLRDRRILLPGNTAYEHGTRHSYEWGGNTAYIGSDGWVGHFNRFFDRDDAPPEVALVRSYLDRVKPALTLDLHEGIGDKYYTFIPPLETPMEMAIAVAMSTAITDRGYPLSTHEELAEWWGPLTEHLPRVARGLYGTSTAVADTGPAFGWYAQRFGASFTTEPGMDNSVENRTNFVEWASRAAIRVFEGYFRG